MDDGEANSSATPHRDAQRDCSVDQKMIFPLVSLPPSFPRIFDIVDYDTVQLHSVQVANIMLARHQMRFVMSRGTVNEVFCIHPDRANSLRYSDVPRPYIMVWKPDDVERKLYLLTIRAELPPTPLPEVFLQIKQYSYMQQPVLKEDGSKSSFVPKSAQGSLMWQIFDTRGTLSPEHPPVTLAEIMPTTSRYEYPTDTQLVDLVRRILRNLECLPSTVFYYVTPHHIIITNPDVSGNHDHPQLEYRLCPFVLGMANAKEMPICSNRQDLIFRSVSLLPLYMATRVTDLNDDPNICDLVRRAIHRYPGLMSLFEEMWPKSNPSMWSSIISITTSKGLDDYFVQLKSQQSDLFHHISASLRNEVEHGGLISVGQKMALERLQTSMDKKRANRDLEPQANLRDALHAASPAASTLLILPTIERTKHAWRVQHIGGLLLLISAMDMREFFIPAIETIWHLIVNAPKSSLGMLIGPLSEVPWLLIPTGKAKLVEPASSAASAPWIKCMNSLEQVLFECSRAPQHCLRLRRAQQLLLEHDIASQLGGSLIGGGHKFSYKVLMPICRVSTMMALHFPIMQTRLIFDRNVRKMGSMVMEAAHTSRNDIHPMDRDRFICMMLVMSNFGSWCSSGSTIEKIDVALMNIWTNMSDDTFLLYILPTINYRTDQVTLSLVSKKLAAIFTETSNHYARLSTKKAMDQSESSKQLDLLHKKLSFMGEWMVSITWNANEQVASHSFAGKRWSLAAAIAFRKMRHHVILHRAAHQTNAHPPVNEHVQSRSGDVRNHPDKWSQVGGAKVALVSEMQATDAELMARSGQNLLLLYRQALASHSNHSLKSNTAQVIQETRSSFPIQDTTSSSGTVSVSTPKDDNDRFEFREDPGHLKTLSNAMVSPQLTTVQAQDDYSVPSAPAKHMSIQEMRDIYASPCAESFDVRDHSVGVSSGGISTQAKHDGAEHNLICGLAVDEHLDIRCVQQWPLSLLLNSIHTFLRQFAGDVWPEDNCRLYCNLPPLTVLSLSTIGTPIEDTIIPQSSRFRPLPRGYGAPHHAQEAFFAIPPTRLNVDIENHLPSTTVDGRTAPTSFPGMHTPTVLEPVYDSIRTLLTPRTEPSVKLGPNHVAGEVRYSITNLGLPYLPSMTSNPETEYVQRKTPRRQSISELAPQGSLLYGATYNRHRSAFDPVTMRTNIPLCRTYPKQLLPDIQILDQSDGTTGMMQVRIVDSGETNGIIIGVGWGDHDFVKSSCDEISHVVPGHSPNSLGFQVSSGCLLYWSNGSQVKSAISESCGTGSVICIGVAHRSVYVMVDGALTYVVPNFLLPSNTRVYGLLRIECAGVKVTSKFMTRLWDNEPLGDDTMRHARSNPVAHQLVRSQFRSVVCPHWRASVNSELSRPLSEAFESQTIDLPPDLQEMKRLVMLARAPCLPENCPAQREMARHYNELDKVFHPP